MPQWLTTTLSTLSTVLPSLIVGVCTAVITVRLSLRRFHAERWWERKADAYSRIVEALHGVMEYCSARSHEDRTGRETSEEKKRQLLDDYNRAIHELKKATGVGAYIISDAVAVALARLEARPRLDPKECAWFELFDADYDAYKKTLAEIRELAKKDLRV